MRQERSDVDMPFGLLFTRCLGIVNHGYKPVPVVPDVEDHIAVHRISVLEGGANFVNIVPPDCLDDNHPRFDFVRRIFVTCNRLAQMLTGNDMHLIIILHNM